VLLAFIEGRLEPHERDAFAAHLETCVDCLELVGLEAQDDAHTIRAQPAGVAAWTLARGASVGRYVIVDQAGRGGMSEVYAAYDPELDRKVALKLLYGNAAGGGSADGRGEARLLREAKAIAKLSHPNVVTVHDAGTVGTRIFVAMEFVDGHTVTEWLAEKPRTRPEILDVFKAAARGLAAAHAAGLVHRDFKPHNVMVGKDGAVRVMDFGLVRDLRAEAPEEAKADVEASFRNDISQLELTRTGELLGTPRYMAPEQFRAEATDARTDQFSFCVALYEALYGQRPFTGNVLSELMKNVIAGKVNPPPAKTTVPPWLRRVLLRGLEVAPAWRFASMNELIAALENDPSVKRRRIAMGLAGAVAIGAIALAARSTAGHKAPLCREGAQHWSNVWSASSPQREVIHRAFAATGKSYAERAFSAAIEQLDGYVASWLDMYREACEATAVKGEQSAEVLDLRMACLNERVVRTKAAIDVLAHADGTVVENAVSVASGLPPLERCGDVALLRAVVKPPDDENVRKRVEALRVQLAQLEAERDAGHCTEAESLAKVLIPQARETSYQPFVADVAFAAGMSAASCAGAKAGSERFREAYLSGLTSGHDEAAAGAAAILAQLTGDFEGDAVAGREWLAVGRALHGRIGGNIRIQSWLLQSEGGILCTEGKPQEAVTTFEKARALKIRSLGSNSLDVYQSSMSIGNALMLAGRLEESRAESASTVEGLSRLLGPEHPLLAVPLFNEGEALNALGRFEEAKALFQRALAIYRAAKADPWRISYALTGLGRSYVGANQPAEAVPPLEEALRARVDAKDSPEHLGETRFALAQALWPTDRARARGLAKQARDDYARVPSAKKQLAEVDRWLEKR
jgi:tetratricopeptide (TPR) repeat protein